MWTVTYDFFKNILNGYLKVSSWLGHNLFKWFGIFRYLGFYINKILISGIVRNRYNVLYNISCMYQVKSFHFLDFTFIFKWICLSHILILLVVVLKLYSSPIFRKYPEQKYFNTIKALNYYIILEREFLLRLEFDKLILMQWNGSHNILTFLYF